MKELETGGHLGIKSRVLAERALASLGHDAHGQLLCSHIPSRALYMDHGRGTQEALLAAVRLLGDGGMQTNDGRHGRVRLDDMLAHDATNLRMGVLRIRVIELSLARRVCLARDRSTFLSPVVYGN